MANDSPANDVHLRSSAHSGIGGCLAVLSVVVGILLLLPGLCSLFIAVEFGREAKGFGVFGIVLIAGGLAFVVGAVKIWSAAKGPEVHHLPGPAAILPEAPDRTGSGV